MNHDQPETPPDVALHDRYQELLTGSWMTQVIYVAAELKIADLLWATPAGAADLAAATGTHAPSLHRLLRALVSLGLCRERDDGAFELTDLGGLMREEAPGSLHAWSLWWGGRLWRDWGALLHSVRTGESARAALEGAGGFAPIERDPDAAAIFNRATSELSRLDAPQIAGALDCSDCASIADLGGGGGEVLAAVLEANPAASGILFELPQTIEDARQGFSRAYPHLVARCEFLAGDFMDEVPAGADAYMLKSVIHDWDDERCCRILGNCRRAMTRRSRLLVLETLRPARTEPNPENRAVSRSDLTMLVAQAGRERTASEIEELLNTAGFELLSNTPSGTTFTLLEARPRW